MKIVPARLGELREYRRPFHCGSCWRVGEPEPPTRYAIAWLTVSGLAVLPSMTRQSSEVWETTRSARKRLDHGRSPRHRRDQITSIVNDATGRRDYSYPRSSAPLVDAFPALIKCPSCRHVNSIELADLSAVLK